MRTPDAKLDVGTPPWRCSNIELDYPDRFVGPKARLGHTPFAFWLMGALRPRIVVDLGVSTGAGYCALLQAAASLGLETRCFGIDVADGDKASEKSEEASHNELHAYHDPLYGTFSTLVRSSFDNALPLFSEGSIDLLQLEGFETYEDLSKSFASWLPKMSSCGVALFHDTNLQKRGFDVWRFWEDVARRYPSFEFTHSQGLGVAYVGSDPMPPAILALLDAEAAEEIHRARRYFARLGTSVVERFETRGTDDATDDVAHVAGEELADGPLVGIARTDKAQGKDVDGAHPPPHDHVRMRALLRQMTLNAQLERELTEANQEKERYARQVQQIYASQSWRLTAPLRYVITKLRGR